jgi:hypothetical protein
MMTRESITRDLKKEGKVGGKNKRQIIMKNKVKTCTHYNTVDERKQYGQKLIFSEQIEKSKKNENIK